LGIFKEEFNDSWGNDIFLFCGVGDNKLHLTITENKELSSAQLDREDVDKLIELLQNTKILITNI
jgi:hypothetical protein